MVTETKQRNSKLKVGDILTESTDIKTTFDLEVLVILPTIIAVKPFDNDIYEIKWYEKDKLLQFFKIKDANNQAKTSS